MPRLIFTQQLTRFVNAPEFSCEASTLSEALGLCFQNNPQLGSYILDEQSHIRQHVAIFINGQLLADRKNLGIPLESDSQVYILQALSGG